MTRRFQLGLVRAVAFLVGAQISVPVAARDEEAKAESADVEPVEPQSDIIDPRSPNYRGGALWRGWKPGPPRWFVAARGDLGFLFVRPRAVFGYGRPHQHWAGLDVVPILSAGQAGVYSGLRYRHPRFEIRSGGLYSRAFKHAYLEAGDKFNGRDLEIIGNDVAVFGASDSEMTFSIPLGSLLIGSETQMLYVFGVPEDKYVFVDTVGAVVAPPWAFRQRVYVGHPFPGFPALFVAPAAEVVFVPERTDPWVLRAGAIAGLYMYQDVTLGTEILPTVKSPDTLGRAGAPWFQITLRVRWATN